MDELEMPLSDQESPEEEPEAPERRAAWLRALRRVSGEHLVPVLLTAGLSLAPRGGYFSLLPLPGDLDQAYGNLALLFGVAAALIGSVTFGRAEARFDIPVFLRAVGAGLVTVIPAILARAGLTRTAAISRLVDRFWALATPWCSFRARRCPPARPTPSR